MSDILKTQQSFARKAQANQEHHFKDLYHLLCRWEWITQALGHVLSNDGSRAAGADGISRKDLKTVEEQAAFIAALQNDLKSGNYQPTPVRRKWIPKPGKTEKRGLGIPTIRDRVVQELLRMLMEPIWESDFLDCSFGFRPGRRTMDCISVCYSRIQTQNKFLWIIEGDIRKCFDRINHSTLLKLIRHRIIDQRIVSLIKGFLKAGILDDGLFKDTPEGTPQGGILSPLLANIYLHQLDLWWWNKFGSLTRYEKTRRRQAKQGNAILVRYADDFIILWNGTHKQALTLRDELKQFLWDELHLELSAEKTHVTHVTDGFNFLGFHLQWELPNGRKPWLRVIPTKENVARFRAKIKALTKRGTTFVTQEMKFKSLNRIIRGWGNYYRNVSFSHDAIKLDYWLNQRVLIWLKHKHQGKGVYWLLEQYKQREVSQKYNRWNFGVKGSDGKTHFIAKLQDIPLRAYRREEPQHPYLKAKEPFPIDEETDTPFLDTKVINVNPESLAWMETRAKILERDEYRCSRCGKSISNLEVHHIKAKRHGGKDDLENLETLCAECHAQTPTYGRPSRVEKSNREPDDAKVSRPVRRGG